MTELDRKNTPKKITLANEIKVIYYGVRIKRKMVDNREKKCTVTCSDVKKKFTCWKRARHAHTGKKKK